MHDSLEKVAKILGISQEDARNIITSAFRSEDPFSALNDLLGYHNIELIFDLYKQKDTVFDIRNEQPMFIEQIIPETKKRTPDPSLLIETGSLKSYFPYAQFNPVQSAVFKDVYTSDGNILVAAPTGAGKTDIALLAVLRALRHQKSQIIYVVPMKALASEIFSKYSKLLRGDIPVIEYTGDTEIDSKTAAKARVIVCTPEKFDAATRRLSCVFQNIRLVILDEIHLLEDDRGPVIEAIVARMFRISEIKQEPIRLIGLSATLPNYMDVAVFIKAVHIHFFDQSYRPVPLKMVITGFTKASKHSDELDYLASKTREYIEKGKQVLIFVHSRAKTHSLAQFFLKNVQISNVDNQMMKNLSSELYRIAIGGVGIHHAGLSKRDRYQMEEMFKKGAIRVLVTTSTLAWGVNLPAYAVIINGSTFYNPQIGKFSDISILDVLQIFGRAGRPQYDRMGEATLITTSNKIDEYIALLKRSKDIESRMLFHVPEIINAEIYLGTVTSIATALLWIKSTFLYVRMLQNPSQYGIPVEEIGAEEQALSEYIYLTVKRLEDCRLIEIERKDSNYNTWTFRSTLCGQIASIYYINHLSVYKWLLRLSDINGEMSLIGLLIKSEEFKPISVRSQEITHLKRLHEDIILDGGIHFDFDETPESKVLILLVSFMKYKRMQIFSLSCDTDFIVENMKRLLAAISEIFLHSKAYEAFMAAFILEKKLYRYKRENIKEPSVSAVQITDKFVDLRITDINGPSTVILKDNGKIVYAFKTTGTCAHIFECNVLKFKVEVHSNNNWTVGTSSEIQPIEVYSPWGLYMYGIHCCDTAFRMAGTRHDCIHFEGRDFGGLPNTSRDETFNNVIGLAFSVDIDFVEVSACHFREMLVMISNMIGSVEMDDVLIVCPSQSDAKETQLTLNAQAGLKGDSKVFGIGQRPNNDSKRWICAFKEALDIRRFKRVVFKGIGTSEGLFPLSEILKICDGRKAIVYETYTNIRYIRAVIE